MGDVLETKRTRRLLFSTATKHALKSNQVLCSIQPLNLTSAPPPYLFNHELMVKIKVPLAHLWWCHWSRNREKWRAGGGEGAAHSPLGATVLNLGEKSLDGDRVHNDWGVHEAKCLLSHILWECLRVQHRLYITSKVPYSESSNPDWSVWGRVTDYDRYVPTRWHRGPDPRAEVDHVKNFENFSCNFTSIFERNFATKEKKKCNCIYCIEPLYLTHYYN